MAVKFMVMWGWLSQSLAMWSTMGLCSLMVTVTIAKTEGLMVTMTRSRWRV